MIKIGQYMDIGKMLEENRQLREKEICLRLERSLKEALVDLAPDWLLHHVELHRFNNHDMTERTEIRLIINQIGSVVERKEHHHLHRK